MQILNSRQAAELLGIKPLFLYQMVRRGKIPAHSLPSKGKKKIYRFIQEELEAWIKEQ